MPLTSVFELADPAAHDVARARQLFFERRADPSGLVPDVIARSWQRCVGRVYEQAAAPEPVAALALAQRRELRSRLRRHALPEIEALAEALAPGRTVVVLSDAQGMILDALGSGDFLRRAERVALQPGVEWSEAERGTNAIGTALVEDRPVTVLGGEHYVSANRVLGCTAVPLHAPDGMGLGVLDVSGEPREIGAPLAALLRMAAGLIEHRIALDPAPRTAVLRFARDSALLGTHREGLLWVRDGELTGANRAALALLGTALDALRGRPVEAFFSHLPALRQGELPVALQDRARSQQFTACWQGIQVPGTSARRVAVAGGAPPARDAGRSAEPPRGEPLPVDALAERELQRAVRVLDAGMAVLVHGETGVGKEVFTRRLHGSSTRRGGPLVAVNCAALPEGLIEAELFGYEEGAFTGARRKGQPGRIREAHGGVLFLDEIGDMPLALQARLLRVLQEREVQPLGGGRAQAVDFALVCATHRDLAALVEQGRFRADLLFRLQHYVVRLPALRERADREALVARLVRDTLEPAGLGLTEEALQALCRYRWPGNLRQLAATLRTVAALAGPHSVIGLEDLPPELRQGTVPAAVPVAAVDASLATVAQPLRTQAEAAIDAALAACGGNVSAAARRLGVHRSTLHRHLRGRAGGH
ncbi:sigma-54-dependent Fis family transcriptional regulator [Caldimonas tepidiphila]|uniref:sigma-54-dependent Fis family transcriptional regulator n=1 Tax=Caldimonas tepidiphila TaxID=2315841 RepID=UPI000E5B4EE0|nr:sigma-54-dependent Fis family transcriptional regulator [Caldimonas tepidiphila]